MAGRSTSQYAAWCWTLNNPTAEEMLDADQLAADGDVQYLCYGIEVGAEGTTHLQGYLEYHLKKTLSHCKKLDGLNRAHFERRMGTQEQAITYCKKDGEFYEFGEKKLDREGQNKNLKQERLREVRKRIHEGATEDEIFDSDPVVAVAHSRWIEKEMLKKKPKRETEIEVLLFHGRPGTGKTRRAYEMYPDIWAVPLGKDIWFNGYYGQKQALIDDFSGNMSLTNTLRMLDRYPIQVPTKGGFTWWCPDVIIITTNVHPRDWYNYAERKDSEKALWRRITKVFDYDNLDEIGDPTQLEKEVYWVVH